MGCGDQWCGVLVGFWGLVWDRNVFRSVSFRGGNGSLEIADYQFAFFLLQFSCGVGRC